MNLSHLQPCQFTEGKKTMPAHLKSSAVKAAILVAALGFGATGVMAQPYASRPVHQAPGIGENVDLVQYYKKKKRVDRQRYKREQSRRWAYDSHRHGKRYRSKHAGYGYYRDGWWYSRPYWNSAPGINIHIGL